MSETIDGLKQRLVGAFVILSLAIIFLPMIFDKPHLEKTTAIVPVPPIPEFKTVVIAQPKSPSYKVLELDKVKHKVVKASRSDMKKSALDSLPKKANSDSKKLSTKKTSAHHTNAKKMLVLKKKALSNPAVSNLPVFKNVWMVQLGTFSVRKNAYRLRDRLRSDGIDSHTKNISLKGKSAIRVFTGPFVNKREAQKAKKKLDGKYKVDSRILFFDA